MDTVCLMRFVNVRSVSREIPEQVESLAASLSRHVMSQNSIVL